MPTMAARRALLLLCGALGFAAVRAQNTTSVYLGSGCFWHTQYDFYVVEKNVESGGDRPPPKFNANKQTKVQRKD